MRFKIIKSAHKHGPVTTFNKKMENLEKTYAKNF